MPVFVCQCLALPFQPLNIKHGIPFCFCFFLPLSTARTLCTGTAELGDCNACRCIHNTEYIVLTLHLNPSCASFPGPKFCTVAIYCYYGVLSTRLLRNAIFRVPSSFPHHELLVPGQPRICGLIPASVVYSLRGKWEGRSTSIGAEMRSKCETRLLPRQRGAAT